MRSCDRIGALCICLGCVSALVKCNVHRTKVTSRQNRTPALSHKTELIRIQVLSDAQSNLGAMYCKGTGVPQDLTKAARLFKLAADQGDADAITTLPIILRQHLFPPGTKVKLAGLKATMLNGLCGVVVQHGAAAPFRHYQHRHGEFLHSNHAYLKLSKAK